MTENSHPTAKQMLAFEGLVQFLSKYTPEDALGAAVIRTSLLGGCAYAVDSQVHVASKISPTEKDWETLSTHRQELLGLLRFADVMIAVCGAEEPEANDATPSDLIRVKKAAEIVGCCPETIRNWSTSHGLKEFREGSLPMSPVLVSESQVRKIMQELLDGTKAKEPRKLRPAWHQAKRGSRV